jgi:hypothetical protein
MVQCSNTAPDAKPGTARKHVPTAAFSRFSQRPVASVTGLAYSTLAMAATTASMFFGFSAATQMRPESTP